MCECGVYACVSCDVVWHGVCVVCVCVHVGVCVVCVCVHVWCACVCVMRMYACCESVSLLSVASCWSCRHMLSWGSRSMR